ncbi:cornifelin homolog B-like [Osmerus eperlanus]|uniref:cornifelin homolog B-like n=1 Tax=Osmerus eperlanus TaxID=29151 RepID=UPI002E11AC81
MMASIVIVQQPAASTQKVWTSGIWDCFQDMNSCCLGFWCLPCAACQTSAQFGESTCLPILDFLASAWIALCGMPISVPPVALSLRVAMRHKYEIQGSICDDIVITCCCLACSWCQMAREIKAQKVGPTVQSVTYCIQPQPATTAVHAWSAVPE